LSDKATATLNKYQKLVAEGSLGAATTLRKKSGDIPELQDWANVSSGRSAQEMAARLLTPKGTGGGISAALKQLTAAANAPGTAQAPDEIIGGVNITAYRKLMQALETPASPEEVEWQKYLMGEPGRMKTQEERDKYIALLDFAGKLAGSKSPSLGGAFGEAFGAAAPKFAELGNQRRAREEGSLKARAELARSMRGEKAESGKTAATLLKEAMSGAGGATTSDMRSYVANYVAAQEDLIAAGKRPPASKATLAVEGTERYQANAAAALQRAQTGATVASTGVTKTYADISKDAYAFVEEAIGVLGSHGKEYRKITDPGEREAFTRNLFNEYMNKAGVGAPAAPAKAAAAPAAKVPDTFTHNGKTYTRGANTSAADWAGYYAHVIKP
jgi:hypothetical protein